MAAATEPEMSGIDAGKNIFVRGGGVAQAVNGREGGAIIKCRLLDVGDTARDGDGGKRAAIAKCFEVNGSQMVRQSDVGQSGAEQIGGGVAGLGGDAWTSSGGRVVAEWW